MTESSVSHDQGRSDLGVDAVRDPATTGHRDDQTEKGGT